MNGKRLYFLTFIFFLIFSVLAGLQNILLVAMSKYDYQVWGGVSLGVFYISLGVFSLASPKYSTRMAYRATFFVGIIPLIILLLSFDYSMECLRSDKIYCE